MAALFRWGTPTMGSFLSRLILGTKTVPAWSASAGYDTMLAFIVPAAAQSFGFCSRAHRFALDSDPIPSGGGEEGSRSGGRAGPVLVGTGFSHSYFTMSSNSTSNTRVAPGLIAGGEPRSP